MACRHVNKHEIRPAKTIYEKVFRFLLRENGWLDEGSGYCEAYYPVFLDEAMKDQAIAWTAMVIGVSSAEAAIRSVSGTGKTGGG